MQIPPASYLTSSTGSITEVRVVLDDRLGLEAASPVEVLRLDEALTQLTRLDARIVHEPPDSQESRSPLPWAYAVPERREDAVRAARGATDYLALKNDAFIGTWTRYYRVLANWEIGAHDEAPEELEHLLSHPSELSVKGVRRDPLLAPLREHPRLQELLREHG
jgi:hypothetical protein